MYAEMYIRSLGVMARACNLSILETEANSSMQVLSHGYIARPCQKTKQNKKKPKQTNKGLCPQRRKLLVQLPHPQECRTEPGLPLCVLAEGRHCFLHTRLVALCSCFLFLGPNAFSMNVLSHSFLFCVLAEGVQASVHMEIRGHMEESTCSNVWVLGTELESSQFTH